MDMATARKRPVQQELFRHGGRRKGAGRKPKGARAGSRHQTRPEIDDACVLHVVLRVTADLGNLRRREMYQAIRAATIAAAKRGWIRIAHLSIQHNHLHLLVEAESKQRLAQGMLGFQVSAARQINRALGRSRGKVFADRYHLVVITSPTQTRRALSYILNNWRKHGEDGRTAMADPHPRGSTSDPRARGWMTDPYSSGRAFRGWRELDGQTVVTPGEPTCGVLVVSEPRAWLLREGWARGGGAISAYEVPSRAHRR